MAIIKCTVSNIEWVYDDEEDIIENGGKGVEHILPNIVNMIINHTWNDITREEAIDIVSDELSDRYGFLHNGFVVDELDIQYIFDTTETI